jgi:hypothetical protein
MDNSFVNAMEPMKFYRSNFKRWSMKLDLWLIAIDLINISTYPSSFFMLMLRLLTFIYLYLGKLFSLTIVEIYLVSR